MKSNGRTKKENTVRTDCFAYLKDSPYPVDCGALTQMVCEKGECPFYKSQEEFENGCKDYGIENQDKINRLAPATLKFYCKEHTKFVKGKEQ